MLLTFLFLNPTFSDISMVFSDRIFFSLKTAVRFRESFVKDSGSVVSFSADVSEASSATGTSGSTLVSTEGSLSK